jgi:hypothetical protein
MNLFLQFIAMRGTCVAHAIIGGLRPTMKAYSICIGHITKFSDHHCRGFTSAEGDLQIILIHTHIKWQLKPDGSISYEINEENKKE